MGKRNREHCPNRWIGRRSPEIPVAACGSRTPGVNGWIRTLTDRRLVSRRPDKGGDNDRVEHLLLEMKALARQLTGQDVVDARKMNRLTHDPVVDAPEPKPTYVRT